MKLYVTTYTSPYARLARIVIAEKGLEDRIEIIEAKRASRAAPTIRSTPQAAYPISLDDTGIGMEDSQFICAYLDGIDGKPLAPPPAT